MTVPGLGGQQPPPQNAAPAAQLVPGITPGTSGQIIATRVIIFGPSGGLFVYNGTPAAGNPPIFWASDATSDLFGNTITPTAGVAGTGQFNAGDTIINAAGVFTYSGTPATGNLIVSNTTAAGTDEFGNTYLSGVNTYFWVGGSQFAVSMSTEISTSPALSFENLSSPGTLNPAVYGNSQTAAGAFNQIVLSSGQSSGGATPSSIAVEDSSVGGKIILTAAGNVITMTGAAVTAQSFTSAGDMSVQGSQLFVGNGATAEVVLNPKQSVNAAATHISTTPTAAEFNSVVDLINSIRTAGINIGLWA